MRISSVALSLFVGVTSVRRDMSEKASSNMNELKNLARTSSALQRLVSLQGQAVTPQVANELTSVKEQLDGPVSQQIQTSHDGANSAVSNIVANMTTLSDKIGTSLTEANSENNAWVKCVESELGALETYYQEMDTLDTMKDTAADKKQAQEAAGPFTATSAELSLDCDIKVAGNCDAAIAKLKEDKTNAVGSVEQSKKDKEGVHAAAKAEREQADQAVTDQTAKAASQYDDTYQGLVSECASKKATRDTFICHTLGEQMKKGNRLDKSYNDTMNEINTPDGALSHPDRVGEWTSTKLASCLIGMFLDDKTLDVAQCSGGIDFATQVGTIDSKASEVSAIMASGHYPCRDGDSVSFVGDWKVDDVAQGTKRTVSAYHKLDGWVASTDFTLDGSTAFTYCTK